MSDAATFVVSFTRDDLVYLAAAAQVDRKGIAWFDLDTPNVRLLVLGNQLGFVRPLGATVTKGAVTPTVTGFGIAAAELPSVVRRAAKERWVSLDLEITPHDDTGTVVQDRTVVTGGIPLEDSLLAGILEEDKDDVYRPNVTISWQRPDELDQLKPTNDGIALNLPVLRECLVTADKLTAGTAGNPQYEVLEFADGIGHAGALNLRFCIEAPDLKGVALHLHQSQLRPLAALFERFDPLTSHQVFTTSQHHVFTDNLATIYTVIPAARPPQQAGDVLSNLPNTQAEIQSAPMKERTAQLRLGRGARVRNRVLRIELADAPNPRVTMEAYLWGSAKKIGRAQKLPPDSSETVFDILTEQVLVEKVLTACNGRVVLQASPEWLYIRSKGQFTQLTAKIRAYARDHRRIEMQLSGLPKLT